ncbi:hypothetical protein HYH03_000228 [Edaphochlamys debaryana]|uniref:HotDog ACOT-type domain-containing protein n=1 Tax=Edaphochlamys debaryana TaxID=47281 RepID=A0A835YIA6_9CHLO|nr:hypothetical protein HYH03_000228 [Edaphochlamys debaryana]|eukprot:KAG2501728.1 hypothetical protein HYH03_000228 [Edaphochlamys debaryana]
MPPLDELRLEEPSDLRMATEAEAVWVVPFSWEVGEHRHRPMVKRGVTVRFKPRGDDPVGPVSHGTDFISKATGGLAAPSASPPASTSSPTAATAAASSSGPGPHTPAPSPNEPGPLPERSPADSHIELIFPFSSNATLRHQYQRFMTDRMRFGLLLEDLDTLAADIAARHSGLSNRVLLTAAIDRIQWLRDSVVGEVTMAHDLRAGGQVVWAGRSSMEVRIELYSCDRRSSPPDVWNFIGLAYFVFVSRTPDRTAAADVPPLTPRTEREKALFEAGKAHMQSRTHRRESHWARKPPTAAEVSLVHDLVRNQHLYRKSPHAQHSMHGQRGPSGAQQDSVPMRDTELQSSTLMHSQDRNAFNVIFGGHLLRLAYEHAAATAAMFAGEYCEPVSMDDVAFLQPVPIATLLRLTGQVVYTEGPVVRVHVRATKLKPGAPEQNVVTNVFSFAFASSGAVRRVVPETMVEAMEYVLGHRQHAADTASRAVAESHARAVLSRL